MNSGVCVSDSVVTPTGSFELDFEGVVNSSNSSSKVAGEGEVEFNHFYDEYLYAEQNLGVASFPIATLEENGIYSVLWIEPLTGFASTIKFFGFYVARNRCDSGVIGAEDNYVLFGDLQLSGSSLSIKCVRAVGQSLNLDCSKSGNDLGVAADGDMIDPAILGDELQFPICED
jgi:hypothetical protein